MRRRKEFGGQTSFRRSNSLPHRHSAEPVMPETITPDMEEDEDLSYYITERECDVEGNPIPVRRMAGN